MKVNQSFCNNYVIAMIGSLLLHSGCGGANESSVDVSFVNFSKKPLSLFWHNGNKEYIQMGTVQPYETMVQSTFEGHLFAYGSIDDDDNVRTEYTVTTGQSNGRAVVAMNADESVPVLCTTTKGDLRITIKPSWSPLGAGRFLDLLNQTYFDGCALNRVVPRFLTQLGIGADYEQRTSYRLRNIPDDISQGIPFQPGTMAYAGSGQDSRSTEFFIVMPETPPSQLEYFGNNPWETPFGYVHPDDVTNVVGKWYSYGDMPPWGQGPVTGKMYQKDGYEYLRREFPNLDYIETCRILEQETEEEEL